MRINKWVIAAATIATLAIAIYGWRVQPRTYAKFKVTFRPTDEMNRVVVNAEYRVQNADTLHLRALLQNEAMEMHVEEASVNGQQVAFGQKMEPVRHNEQTHHFLNVYIPGKSVRLRYSVLLGADEGDPHSTGLTGGIFGVHEENWALSSLAQFALLPAVPGNVRDIKFSYSIPAGWSKHAAVFDGQIPRAPDDPVASRIEDLFFAPLAVGKFIRNEFQDMKLIVCIPESCDRKTALRFASELHRFYGATYDLLGTSPSAPYLLVVAPVGADGRMPWVESTFFGSVVSYSNGKLIGNSGTVKRFLVRAIEDIRLREKIANENDTWFQVGVVRYFADRLAISLGLRERESLGVDLAREYGEMLSDRDVNLSSNTDLTRPNKIATKAGAVLYILDETLREQAGDSLDSFMATLSERGKIASVADELTEYFKFDVRPMFDRYVYGAELLPIPRIKVPDRAPLSAGAVDAVIDSIALVCIYDGKSYLENCGCKVNQSGGVARTANWIRNFRHEFDGDVIFISTGNTFPLDHKNFTLNPLQGSELELYLSLMADMGLDCAVVGGSELYYGTEFFRNIAGRSGVAYVSANLWQNGETVTDPYRVYRSKRRSVAIVGVTRGVHENFHSRIWDARTTDVEVLGSVEDLRGAIDAAKTDADMVVVAGGTTPTDSRTILDRFTSVDVVVSERLFCFCESDGKSTTEDQSGFYKGRLVLHPRAGTYGVSTFVLYLGADNHIVSFSERLTMMTDEIADDSSVRDAINTFYEHEAASVDKDMLEPAPTWLTSVREGATYVGAQACAGCHVEQYQQWLETSHGSAFQTLLKEHRNYVPKCVKCHVTGFAQPSGYEFGDMSSSLANVQCESCHGPGGDHVKTRDPATITREINAAICADCHDDQHSDMTRENFLEYFKKIVH